ncbi:MAG: Asp23/Gls24 family envelope stress response protein [Candidatus Geothermincolia bacterium]
MDFKMRPGIPELIAGIALLSVEGACGIGLAKEGEDRAGKKKNLVKGIRSTTDDESISLDLDITVEYGADMIEVGHRVQKQVAEAVAQMTGLQVEEVNVNVVRVDAS